MGFWWVGLRGFGLSLGPISGIRINWGISCRTGGVFLKGLGFGGWRRGRRGRWGGSGRAYGGRRRSRACWGWLGVGAEVAFGGLLVPLVSPCISGVSSSSPALLICILEHHD